MLRTIFSYMLWPLLLCTYISGIYAGFSHDMPVLGYNITFVVFAILLVALERIFPFEKQWASPDGQFWQDIGHTLLCKGFVQGLIVLSGAIGLSELITTFEAGPPSWSVWPREWPLVAQIVLTMFVAEFALYWSHRLGHEWHLLWRFHTVHHSVTRLWVVNTGRFHFIDSLVSVTASVTLLTLLGAPMEMLMWFGALTPIIGLLTHSNIDMKTEWLSWLFITPALHRWHHSRDLTEGNTNYGENLAIWDLLFRTWYLPADRRPPANIGISEPMPGDFAGQLLFPIWYREEIE